MDGSPTRRTKMRKKMKKEVKVRETIGKWGELRKCSLISCPSDLRLRVWLCLCKIVTLIAIFGFSMKNAFNYYVGWVVLDQWHSQAFPGGQAAHPVDQIEEENEENEEKWDEIIEIWGKTNVPLLPTRGWGSGYTLSLIYVRLRPPTSGVYQCFL